MFKTTDQAGSGAQQHWLPNRRAYTATQNALTQRANWLAASFVVIITVWRLQALAESDVDLFFDEAQYWFWAKDPAFGYFSKPPLLAWLIELSTWLLGDTEFAIRAVSPVCYAITALFAGMTGGRLYGGTAAAWTAAIVATLPGVSVSATIASTDVPLLMCWAIALYCWVRYSEDGGWWWVGLGFALGAGLMAKYAMIYFLLGLCVAFVLIGRSRSIWLRPGAWGALLLAVLLFLPNVWWNWANDFVSFGHTAENANWQGLQLKFHKMGEFVGGQFGVFGPILLIAFMIAAGNWRRLDDGARVLCALALPVLLLMTVQSLVSRAHANWAAVAYVSASIFVVGWLLQQRRSLWLKLTVGLQVAVCGAVLLGPSVAPSTGTDPWHRQRGWTDLGKQVDVLMKRFPDAVLVPTDRKLAAELMFYVEPKLPEMVKWNPDRHIGDHYELISDMASLTGRKALIVGRSGSVKAVVAHFDRFEELGTLGRERPTRPTETYRAVLAKGFRGLD